MTVQLAISLLLALIDRAAAISSIIATAQAAGRTDLTPDEWNTILSADDRARTSLINAILQASKPAPVPQPGTASTGTLGGTPQ
jgi:hypothetical protein